MRTMLLGVLLFMSGVTAAAAQSSWDHASSLAATGGAARADGETGVLFGGSVGWEMSAHFGVEGSGRWMDRDSAPSAYAGEVCARVGLGGTRDGAIPYVVAGVGLHRRSFDVHDQAEADGIPEFYRDRLELTENVVGEHQTFTDPALVMGMGVDVALSRNVVLRPDIRALVVFGDGRRNTVVLATIGLGYRFEHKPVTPARR